MHRSELKEFLLLPVGMFSRLPIHPIMFELRLCIGILTNRSKIASVPKRR